MVENTKYYNCNHKVNHNELKHFNERILHEISPQFESSHISELMDICLLGFNFSGAVL